MLQRKVLEVLKQWKRDGRKCLVLKGQRQVGKSFILREFGKTEYVNYVVLDLYSEPMSKAIFEEFHDVDSIVDSISLLKNTQISPGKTLIILDEIQESTKARGMLKYFSEDGRYDVVASGSMLGVSDARRGTFGSSPNIDLLPVGGEESLVMHSLDFEEFLWATGIKQADIDRVKKTIAEGRPLNEIDMEVFSRRFRAFQIIGGMPEAVQCYVEGGFNEAQGVQDAILDTCIGDINRYNSGIDVVKTKQCFDSIPFQLSETNKRFTYSRIDNGKSRNSGQKYMKNLLWITESGYGNMSRALSDLQQPLKKFSIRDVFKVYMSDTGILLNMMGNESRSAIMLGDTSFNMGAVTENVIAECLMKSGYPLYYYRKTSGNDKMELDLVIEHDGITVIEVKTGAHRAYPSLQKTVDDPRVSRRVVFEKGNIWKDELGIEHYPHFAAAFLFPAKESRFDDGLLEGTVGDPYNSNRMRSMNRTTHNHDTILGSPDLTSDVDDCRKRSDRMTKPFHTRHRSAISHSRTTDSDMTVSTGSTSIMVGAAFIILLALVSKTASSQQSKWERAFLSTDTSLPSLAPTAPRIVSASSLAFLDASERALFFIPSMSWFLNERSMLGVTSVFNM